MTVPVYINEISPPAIIGTFGSFFQLGGVTGIAFSYAVGIGLDWVYTAVVAAILPVAMVVMMLFVPETPYWLMQKNRREDAENSLRWLRGPDADIKPECDQIQETLESNGKVAVTMADYLKKGSMIPLVISIMLMVFQQFSGVNAVLFYTSSIFTSAGSNLSSGVSTLLVGAVQVFVTIISVLISDKAGRRILLLISASVMGISLAALGAYYKVREDNPSYADENLKWLPLVSLMVFISAFSIGYGPIAWLMASEITPPKTKNGTVSIATGLNWSFSFIVTYTFNDMVGSLGTYGTYWFFAGVCAASFVFVLFFVPETKGKSFEKIQTYFERGHLVYLFNRKHLS